jgi:hypothetical protein
MSEGSRRPSRSDKNRDQRNVMKFLEELSWLLSANANLDFRAIAELVRVARRSGANTPSALDSYVSKNPNIHFLIGSLPVMFSDETLFGSNEDIVEFAHAALGLRIGRWDKRSRYELIGFIVCETANLNDGQLDKLVNALVRLVSNDPGARQLLTRRPDKKLSWNEVIQQLTDE